MSGVVMARRDIEQSDGVTTEGRRIKARRLRLHNLPGFRLRQEDLAERSGVSRATLIAVEAGKGFQHATGASINKVLDELEKEHGITEPVDVGDDEETVEFEVRVPGIEASVIVRGPVSDRAELEESVIRLLRGMSQDDRS